MSATPDQEKAPARASNTEPGKNQEYAQDATTGARSNPKRTIAEVLADREAARLIRMLAVELVRAWHDAADFRRNCEINGDQPADHFHKWKGGPV